MAEPRPGPRDALVFYSAFDDFGAWSGALRAELPDLEIIEAAACSRPEEADYALVWKPPAGFFTPFSGLRLVVNLGAGVDRLLGRDDLPDVPITRLSDPAMTRMMAGYVLFAVLRHARNIPIFERAQPERRWAYVHPRPAEEIPVAVLGLGELGAFAASELVRHGFPVTGWSRTPKAIEGVRCLAGPESLAEVLSGAEIVVVMLPATPETRRILGRRELRLLPAGAKFVNVSRGAVVDEPALIDALRDGHIAEATLDVFETEPLPPENPLWTMPSVLITPHLASVAVPASAAPQIAENIRLVRAGLPPRCVVDVERGY